MFSLLNTSNNIDLSQGKNFLQVNKNNEYKLIPNLDLIGSDDNVGSIVEAMSGADSIQANNTVTASNVSKINDEFNQIMIEYIKNYQLLIEQVLKKIVDLEEWHNKETLEKIGNVSWKKSIFYLHGENENDLNSKFYRRLAYDEILANFLVLSQVRKRVKKFKWM